MTDAYTRAGISALGQGTDIPALSGDFRFTLKNGRQSIALRSPLRVKSGRSGIAIVRYSITMKPRAFAVLRLMAKSNLVGCMIGRSPGLAPFNILLM
jgi:hypothetical protein